MYSITKADANLLLSWHSGQGSALYAAGSHAYAGHPVTSDQLSAAIAGLETMGWVTLRKDRAAIDGLLFNLRTTLAAGPDEA